MRQGWYAGLAALVLSAVVVGCGWPNRLLDMPTYAVDRNDPRPVELTGTDADPLEPVAGPRWTLPGGATVFVLGDLVVGDLDRGTGDSDLQAVDGRSGHVRWSARWDGGGEPDEVVLGLDGATVYAGIILSGDGHRQRFDLTAIDAASGRQRWMEQIGEQHRRSWLDRGSSDGEPPSIQIHPTRKAIVATAWASDGSREVEAFDPVDGEHVDDPGDPPANDGDCETGDGLRVCASDGGITATDAETGALRWNTDLDQIGATEGSTMDAVGSEHVAVHSEAANLGTILDADTGEVMRHGVRRLPTQTGNGFVLLHDLHKEYGDHAVGVHPTTTPPR